MDNGDGTSVFVIATSTRSQDEDQVTLAGLTITGGDSKGDDLFEATGGGVSYAPTLEDGASAMLTIRDSVIKNNHAADDGDSSSSKEGNGGGLSVNVSSPVNSFVSVQIIRTEIFQNTAEDSGGGVYVQQKSGPNVITTFELTIDQSTIRDNTAFGNDINDGNQGAGGSGGGIYVAMDGNDVNNDGAVFNLKNSTVSGNTATIGQGGGVWVSSKYGGTFNGLNSTVSGNHAPNTNLDLGQGGGLWIGHFESNHPMAANLDHLTITDNDSPIGGGLFTPGDIPNLFTTTLKHTIASGNRVEAASSSAANNVVGTINVAGSKYNLVGPTNGIFPLDETNGNIRDTDNDPGLMPLLFNGGL